jgi:pyruvate formate lyase activating enzyme
MLDSTNCDLDRLVQPCSGAGQAAVLPIYELTPFTMLDFPDRTACIIWFSGCNMRCSYCHNPQIVKGKGKRGMDDVLDFLKSRQGLLDGVVLSGGEASVYKQLPSFARIIKSMGFAVKLDTNGIRPDIVQNLLEEDLLDYVALDYKAPAHKFKKVTGVEKYKAFEDTLNLLCTQKRVAFEVRTTVHTVLLDEEDVSLIIEDLNQRGYRGHYYVQNFINNGAPTLGAILPQSRTLNIHELAAPKGYTIGFRNFP